ncbi:YbaB/EbfC family nucleoid-associated protein [Saccharopolyspora sp. 5N708]|uniref:YbaB/EbfC family nucleoid-associated protein n=1 Tax=Saccharopolyspora sp. 5N708 TaxID=3457424 RepID=UPI003FD2586D
MSNPSSRRAELEARNAAMRENMTSLLEGISRQTEQLKQAQEQAVATTGKASSDDGLVTVQVNSAGIVTDLQLSSSAFRSTTPRKLSESIVLTIQAAARNARAQADEAFTPILANMPDLPDFFADAPSLKDLIPAAPEVPSGVADDADDDDDDEDVEDEFFASRRENGNY